MKNLYTIAQKNSDEGKRGQREILYSILYYTMPLKMFEIAAMYTAVIIGALTHVRALFHTQNYINRR